MIDQTLKKINFLNFSLSLFPFFPVKCNFHHYFSVKMNWRQDNEVLNIENQQPDDGWLEYNFMDSYHPAGHPWPGILSPDDFEVCWADGFVPVDPVHPAEHVHYQDYREPIFALPEGNQDRSESIGPIRRRAVKKNKTARLSSFDRRVRADNSQLPSDEVIEEIQNLQLIDGEKLVTVNICKRVLLELLIHRITQKKFATAILDKRQGTFSDLVQSPKSWDELTPHGRINYIKMKQWIDTSYEEKEALAKQELDEKL